MCAFVPGFFKYINETEATVLSVLTFMPGMRVVVPSHERDFYVFQKLVYHDDTPGDPRVLVVVVVCSVVALALNRNLFVVSAFWTMTYIFLLRLPRLGFGATIALQLRVSPPPPGFRQEKKSFQTGGRMPRRSLPHQSTNQPLATSPPARPLCSASGRWMSSHGCLWCKCPTSAHPPYWPTSTAGTT